MSDSLASLKAKRDELNSNVKNLLSEMKSERDRLNSLNEKISELKERRDSKNKLVKELATKRKAINEKIRDSIKIIKENDSESVKYEPIPKDHAKLKSEIKKLDWDIQTRHHTIKQDEQMRTRMEKMQVLLSLAKTREKLDRKKITSQVKINKLREELELTEQLLVDNQHAGNKEHEELIVHYNQIKELRDKLAPKFREIKELKKQADDAHKAFITEHDRIKTDRESKINTEKKQRELEATRLEKDMKQKAHDLFNDFTKGKKLTSEELIIIQKYGQ
ncbi:MAG: hypothetical protein V1718_03535 [archaeon]